MAYNGGGLTLTGAALTIVRRPDALQTIRCTSSQCICESAELMSTFTTGKIRLSSFPQRVPPRGAEPSVPTESG